MTKATCHAGALGVGSVLLFLLVGGAFIRWPDTVNVRLALTLVPLPLWLAVFGASASVLFLAFFLTGRRF